MEVSTSVRFQLRLPARQPFGSISSEELAKLLRGYQQKQHEFDPVISPLVNSVKLAGMKVMGSPTKKLTYRQQMLGDCFNASINGNNESLSDAIFKHESHQERKAKVAESGTTFLRSISE